jgi:hypothetical protein
LQAGGIILLLMTKEQFAMPGRDFFRWRDTFIKAVERNTSADVKTSKVVDDTKHLVVYGRLNSDGTSHTQLVEKNHYANGAIRHSSADADNETHYHRGKGEFSLPLTGPGEILVQFEGDSHVSHFRPQLATVEAVLELNTQALGARMENGHPVLVYESTVHEVENHIAHLDLGNGKILDFVYVAPGEPHDFRHVPVGFGSAHALNIGFPTGEEPTQKDDFFEVSF